MGADCDEHHHIDIAPEGEVAEVTITLDFEQHIQLAAQQTRQRLLRSLSIQNHTARHFDRLELTLQLDPEIAQPKRLTLEALAPGELRAIRPEQLELLLSADRLAQQVEKQPGRVVATLRAGDELCASYEAPLWIYAYNEWLGLGAPREQIAAFVMPNHPELPVYLDAVRAALEARQQDPQLEGYQSRDPQRVLALVEAVYAAVGGLKIGYANPPASFEGRGQKIRGTEQVLSDKIATCLDLSVLMASALEQIGVNPLLIFERGHAFVGAWLTDFSSPTAHSDNALFLRKRVDLGECVVFDSSSAADKRPFAGATKLAYDSLSKPGQVELFVDVRAARLEGITPMPSRSAIGWQTQPDHARASDTTSSPLTLPRAPLAPRAQADEAPAAKIERWKNQLLDLTLRNKLLNHRDTKQSLPFLTQSPATVEDALELKQRLELRAREPGQAQDQGVDWSQRALEEGRLIVNLAPAEFERRVLEIFRLNQKMMDESGASALFLSLGMLQWMESASSTTPRYAPLLLIPVTITRARVGGPYHIVRSDDDALLNATLLRKLELDRGINLSALQGGLPTDESGLDVELILRTCLDAVKDLEGFDVIQRADLSFYQFQKFMMWMDLEANREALMANPLVRHLIEGESGEKIHAQGSFVQAATLDETIRAHDDLSVVDADSSQLAAIFSALDGRSFVLQGPPGTGKSQTITNLIAQCLAQNKTVLFVSEKRAALEVVEHRLKQVGLGPFTLELHADHAAKAKVIAQLEEPFRHQWERSPERWEELARSLQLIRGQLNAHAKRMHAPGPFGESLYQAVSQLIKLTRPGHEAPQLALGWTTLPDTATYQAKRASLATLAARARPLEPLADNPWRWIDQTDWSIGWQNQVSAQVREAILHMEAWQRACDEAVEAIFQGHETTPQVFLALEQMATTLATDLAPSPGLLREPLETINQLSREAQQLLTARAEALAKAEQHFKPDIYTLELEPLQHKLVKWAHAFFLLSWIMLYTLRKQLSSYALGELPPNPRLLEGVSAAQVAKSSQATFEARAPALSALFGHHWHGEQTEPASIAQIVSWNKRFREQQLLVREQDPRAAELIEQLALSAERRSSQTRAGRALSALSEAAAPWQRSQQALRDTLRLGDAWDALIAPEQLRTMKQWRERVDALRDWCDLCDAASDAQAQGLSPLVSALRQGALTSASLLPTFERALRELWWEQSTSQDPALRRFRGLTHDTLIQSFQALDQEAQQIARREIQARLAARLPDYQAPGEMDVLRREFKKKSRHKSIRKLFSEAPQALMRAKPCVLMSPLSVARFLDPKLTRFDLVIFDEASQIPPWDAIGAIARGKQALIVGDGKQLPPTSFFSSDGGDDTHEDEDVFDMESILDQAIMRGVPEQTLNWHYRSRHQELIAFSNEKYYRNRLHIFPSPSHDSPSLGVKWVEVPEGVYDRGGSRTNRAEAQRVVALLLERLSDPVLCQRSIGIVTFSSAQQRLIEDLLDETRRAHPELERFFGAEVSEPVFIKNLESVQGDERDVMIFSICYGPDLQGRLSMSFGPLNRQGGERRLNVAVTRARELLLVVSTLRPDQIDLSRSSAVGVEHLKLFLDYAARGTQALREAATVSSARGFDSPFEEEVYDRLTDAGWKVHPQVGVGGFYIDLAVVDPERPGAYLLGVECDGASYHSAKTARDRDRIRQRVLESLGWQIHRIWSTEWWFNREREMTRLLDALREAQQRSLEARLLDQAIPTTAPVEPPTPQLPPRRELDVEPATAWPPEAHPWRAPQEPIGGDKADFYKVTERASLAQCAEALLTQDAPLTLETLTRLINRAWGFTNTTQKQRAYLQDLIQEAPNLYLEGDTVWASFAQRQAWRGFRYTEGAEGRKLEELPEIELREATLWVVSRSLSLTREQLYGEVGRIFSFSRTARFTELMDHILITLAARDKLRLDQDKVLHLGDGVG